jgi:hypothetical protein
MKTGNSEKERVPVTIRIPGRILEQIDASLGEEDVPVSRNHWIIEALVEKLKRTDGGGSSNGAR